MKSIVPAVLLFALPAVAAGQSLTCPEETCQVVPYFAGSGGFVGEPANTGDEDEVKIHVTCASTKIVATVSPDSDGVVRQLLGSAGGLGCRDGVAVSIEIENLAPGGWYWINDARNSAVSALIPKTAAGNEQVEPTDPGAGIVLSSLEDGLATFVKQPSTGRVGIIPHVVPAKPVQPCSGRAGSESASDCHLGSVKNWRLSVNPSSVTRPTGAQNPKEVVVTLHGEGFVVTGDVAARGAIEHHASVERVQVQQEVAGSVPAGDPGILGWLVTVGSHDDRCLPANNDPDRRSAQTITFKLLQMEGVVPDPLDDSVETAFTVNCPADAAASAGAELVPENPFPVD